MTRADLLLYVQLRYNNLLTVAVGGQAIVTDTPVGWGPVLDSVLLALGNPADMLQTATIDVTQVSDAYALADYFALRWLLVLVAPMVDLDVGEPHVNKKRSQVFAQTKILYDISLADITNRGYGPEDFTLGKLQLDILEPLQPGSGAAGYGMGWW